MGTFYAHLGVMTNPPPIPLHLPSLRSSGTRASISAVSWAYVWLIFSVFIFVLTSCLTLTIPPLHLQSKMRLSTLAQVLFTTTTLALDASLGSTLNVTVLGARHNRSTLECWALKPGFETSSEAGTSGSSVLDLGSVTGNATFTTLPAGFDGGRHNAPTLQ